MIIVVDTREKPECRWTFDGMLGKDDSIKIEGLKQGDYGIEGKLDLIAIERKMSISEITANFTTGKARFKRELERLKDNHKYSCIVCSFTMQDLINGPKFSKISAKYLMSALIEIEYAYHIPVHIMGEHAERFTYRLLRKADTLSEKGKSIW